MICLSFVAAVIAAILVVPTTARPLEPTVLVIISTPTPLTASPSKPS